MRRDFGEVKADVGSILRKGDALKTALDTIADHREQMQAYVDNIAQDNEARWTVEAAEYAKVAAKVE